MTSDTSRAIAEGILTKSAPGGGRRNRRAAAAAAASAAPIPASENGENGEPMTEKEKAAAAAAARARDNAVTARLTKTKMCHFFERGKCASSDCRYAHSPTELRQQPNLEKTKLCKTWVQEGYCNDGENCGFAHGDAELKVTEGIYKTQMCHFFERGRCLKGERCNHAHGKEDLRNPVRSPLPNRKNQGASSAGAGGGYGGAYYGEGGNAAVASFTPAVAPGSAMPGSSMGSIGLRSPLSPLPLAELLGDMGGNITNTPSLAAAGMQSPDIFSGMSLWTGMPWTPPAFNPPLVSQPGLGMPMAQHFGGPQNPATPIGGYQNLSASPLPAPMAATAPPPGMASALGGGLGLGLSPAPGLAPATSGVDALQGSLPDDRGTVDKREIVCDLGKRLASLDVVCNSLAADVRDLTASSNQGEPVAAAAAAGDAGRSERLVHRI